MKYCKDCAHFIRVLDARCKRGSAWTQTEDPVWGIRIEPPTTTACAGERADPDACGPEARFYQPKPEPRLPVKTWWKWA